MHELPRRLLVQLVETRGVEIARDADRCEAMLRDLCGGEYRREVRILVGALRERVPAELQSARAGVPMQALLAQLATRLEEELALAKEAAWWAVESWALALQVIDHTDQAGYLAHAGRALRAESVAVEPAVAPPRPPPAVERAAVIVDARGGFDHRSIGAALAGAPPGARILVRPGIYREELVIERAIELVGEGMRDQVIIEGRGAPCVRMATDAALLRGLSLRVRGGSRSGRGAAVEVPRGRLVLEDCDLTSDGPVCLLTHGAGAHPELRRCRVHDGAGDGIVVEAGATAIIEDCAIEGHAEAGVLVLEGGNPTVRGCRIGGGGAAGVSVTRDGRGRFVRCEITGSGQWGVGIERGGDPTIEHCEIHDGKGFGVFITFDGKGTIEDCRIHHHSQAGLAIQRGGRPSVRRCRIDDHAAAGLLVAEKGRGTVEECEFARNAIGVAVASGGAAMLRACVIQGSARAGVLVYAEGEGAFGECEIRGNAGPGVSILAGGNPVLWRCRIHDNQGEGVVGEAGALGSAEECQLGGNVRGAWRLEPGALLRRRDNDDGSDR